jgi:uncharacterized protein
MINMPGLVHRYATAWFAGDLTTVLNTYAPHIVAHYGGTSPFAGDHVGRDRFVEVLLDTAGRSQRQLLAIEAVFDGDGEGALFVRESLILDGARHEVSRALRFRIENDKFVECWLYDHDQHLIDQAWSKPAHT